MSTPTSSSHKWLRPDEVMALHKLKQKKKALQARFNFTSSSSSSKSTHGNSKTTNLTSAAAAAASFESAKRKNPFIRNEENKKPKLQETNVNFTEFDQSADATLFKLLNSTAATKQNEAQIQHSTFSNILCQLDDTPKEKAKESGELWVPIDWSLKTKVRFLSPKPFAWNRILKTSEEASGITGFARCIDTNTISTTLDTSPNARFHQCCLYWQQPSLPWMKLFPRTNGRASETGTSVATAHSIRDSLQNAWSNSLRSLFQLVRARQCPYFYVCANNFTILFRAAGVCGCTEIQALITPTTRGFRQVLKQEDIEFTMPLKIKHSYADDGDADTISEEKSNGIEEDDDDEEPDEEWLSSMGVNAEDIKQINYTQERKKLKAESALDNSEQSLICVEGVEVQALYNFLINCKSTTSLTGPLAGIPPTLLAPVAFNGATLKALKVRESRVNVDNVDYYSLELSAGPILPHIVHNLFSLHPSDNNLTATFANVSATIPFSKVKMTCTTGRPLEAKLIGSPSLNGSVFFGQENLSDCGLSKNILKHFCSDNKEHIQCYECLKYNATNKKYTWS